MTGRVLILDEIDVKPGMTGAVRDAYRTAYRPGAEARGGGGYSE